MKNRHLIPVKAVFIDDGGVMNDNNLRSTQWKDLVGKYFVPRYGGSMDAWHSANEYALNQLLQRYEKTVAVNPQIDYRVYWYEEQILWLTNMFKMVDIEPPPYEERAKVARLATNWITPRVKAAYPGVTETIHFLKKHGFTLYMASGEASWELKGYLTGMEIENCFDGYYGPDLINAAKAGVFFYEKIFNDCWINPREVMVIDDSAEKLSWAAEIGATIVHVLNFKKCSRTTCQRHINQLNELPPLISKFASN